MSDLHELKPELINRRSLKITVVGCGGTGSAFASGLPYLHQALQAKGHYGLDVRFLDGDLISETNCVRQPFSRSEVGLFKSVVLASRLNMFWNLNWGGIGGYLDEHTNLDGTDILVGCVDRRSARKTIHDRVACEYSDVSYWLDIGNDASSGQFVLGQPLNRVNPRNMPERLRTVAELYPEICDFAEEPADEPSCSAIESLTRQQPFVNQVLAMQALAMLSRLLWDGGVPYHGAFVNLATGKTTPLPVDCKQWERLKRWNRKKAA